MAERIVDGTQFNAENIMYTAPKASAQGGKSVNILNKTTKTTLTLSTPLMLTWGASDFKKEGEEVGNGRYELSLQFPGEEYKSADTDAFLKNMKAFEDKIKSDALIYSKEWFGKVHKSAEIIEELFTPLLKYPKNRATGEYDYNKQPTIKLKLPQWDGAWKTEIYDEDTNKLYPSQENPGVTPLDYLKKGSNIACLIQFAGIWFVNGKFSASWKLVQAVVQKPRAQLQGQCFIKLKPQDKEKIKNQTVKDEDDGPIATTCVEDSDEEEEPDEEEEADDEEDAEAPPPVPAPVPVPVPVQAPVVVEEPKVVKKRVVKKKTDA
jgi:hypothetical protein